MRGFSKVVIAGNITRDPELRTTPSGTTVCSFGVAVNRNYRGADGNNKEEVSFFDCSAWGKPGEIIAQYMKRGSGIIVSGRLTQHSWDDRNGGGKRSRVEIVVDDFVFAGGRDGEAGASSYSGSNGGSYGGGSYGGGAGKASAGSEIPDDIPEGEIDLSDVPF